MMALNTIYLFQSKQIMNIFAKIAFAFLLTLGTTILSAQPIQNADKKAEALMKQKKYAEAIPFINEMIKVEPKNNKWYFEKGNCEMHNHNMEGAKTSYAKSIELNPKFVPAYTQMATVLVKQKKYDEAVGFFKKGIEQETVPAKKAQYKMMIVDAYLQKNDLPAAKTTLAELQKSAPENVRVLYYDGEIKMKEKNWAGAKETYMKIVSNPNFAKMKPVAQAQYYYSLGLTCLEMNDETNAKVYWKKANTGKYKDKISERKPEWLVEFDDPSSNNPTVSDVPANSNESVPIPGFDTPANTTPETTTPENSGEGGLDWGF